MSSKQVIGFLIFALTVLALSLIITFGVVLPAKKKLSEPDRIPTYVFNYGTTNPDYVRSLDNELSFKNSISFRPTQTSEFSTGFVHYLGDRVADGVEMSTTSLLGYVCAIPFAVNNYALDDISFSLTVTLDGELKDSISYKIYDYSDKTYKDVGQINAAFSGASESLKLTSGKQANFCLVACATGSLTQTQLDSGVKINIIVKFN